MSKKVSGIKFHFAAENKITTASDGSIIENSFGSLSGYASYLLGMIAII